MFNKPEGQPRHLLTIMQCEKLIFMHDVFHFGKWGLLDLFNLFLLPRQQHQCILFMYNKTSILQWKCKTKKWKRMMSFSVYSCSYVDSSWHKWPQSCTFHVGWVPAGAGWGHSARGPGRSLYTPRHPGSPDRPAAQTTVTEYTATITEPQ